MNSISRSNSATVSSNNSEHGNGSIPPADNILSDNNAAGTNCCEVPADASNTRMKYDKEWVLRGNPYDLYIKLAFSKPLNSCDCSVYADELLYRLKKRIFCGIRNKKRIYLTGFAFIKDQKLGPSRNLIYIHMLMRHDPLYDDFSFSQIEDIFYESVSEVIDGVNERVFNDQGTEITEVRGDVVDENSIQLYYECNRNFIPIVRYQLS